MNGNWQHHTHILGVPDENGERDIVRCACLAGPASDEHGRAWFAEHLTELGAPDYMVEYWRFWSSIVEPTNTGLSRDQVARELFDYRVVMDGASKVYEELAGLSKPNTDPGWILDGAERRYNETHANLILCDLLPQIEDEAARQAVREYAETLHEGAWAEYEQVEKVRAEIRAAKAAEG